jgi:hypothetical protein
MRRFAILFSQRAAREIDATRTWWRSHPSTPDAIDDELAAALQLLEGVPEMDPRVQVRHAGRPCAACSWSGPDITSTIAWTCKQSRSS